jgi:prepilin-type N-terminal cleavage/methylation domain-containing protein
VVGKFLKDKNLNSGFTLTELMVVVAVIGILSAVAVGVLKKLSSMAASPGDISKFDIWTINEKKDFVHRQPATE